MDLDPTDIAILRVLTDDARRSLREVAKAVGVSPPTVAARLAALERLGVVRGYRAVVDPERLNEMPVLLIVRARPGAEESLVREIGSLPWVRRVTVARGGRILVEATAVADSDIDGYLAAVSPLTGVEALDHFVGVRTVKDEPRALLTERLTAALLCFECRKPIEGEPIRLRLDGRDHYVCCRSCERLYRERYERIKAAA